MPCAGDSGLRKNSYQMDRPRISLSVGRPGPREVGMGRVANDTLPFFFVQPIEPVNGTEYMPSCRREQVCGIERACNCLAHRHCKTQRKPTIDHTIFVAQRHDTIMKSRRVNKDFIYVR
jgi:hypothetical protein